MSFFIRPKRTLATIRHMPPKRGTYYLGRLIKRGLLKSEQVIDAIQHPQTTALGKFSWTFTEYRSNLTKDKKGYVFAKLSKYKPHGKVRVVDTKHHAELEREEPDLLEASSPFVYLPSYSGIAYLHVWNEIQQETFVQKFMELITRKYDKFFVDCHIEAISDMRAFAKRIQSLDSISELSAKVVPPNPLFGRFWGPLKEYLKDRHAIEVRIQEKALDGEELNTDLPKIIGAIAAREDGRTDRLPELKTEIGDQAILMAADGYGRGKVVGRRDSQEQIIRTSETIKSFQFDKEPDPAELYNQALEVFRKLGEDHEMRHG